MIFPPGYFLTWHTYGTWLHGDGAGSVDKDHNQFGAPRLTADRPRLDRALASLRHPPVVLGHTARLLVDAVIREHCARRSWTLAALAVRSNHVHVVVAGVAREPELIVKQLKEWGTRKLRSHSIVGPNSLAWADHASTIYLYESGSLARATRYVLTMQDEPPEGHGRPEWQSEYTREP